jgi:hypothetical protein
MQIAPGIDASSWQALKLDDPSSQDWGTAVQILERRIVQRFIEPIDHLIAAEESKAAGERRFGFAVLAIDCLLVETLGAFLEGLEDTDKKSKPTFCYFLTRRPEFSRDFTPALAEEFYYQFRCGILHQAEISGDSKVWSVGPLIWSNGGKVIVNRNKFHGLLKTAFQNYLVELRDPANADLRLNFRKKMDFISRS